MEIHRCGAAPLNLDSRAWQRPVEPDLHDRAPNRSLREARLPNNETIVLLGPSFVCGMVSSAYLGFNSPWHGGVLFSLDPGF